MKLLIVDNYDSFTYNLYHYVNQFVSDVVVIKNDKVNLSQIESFDKIILSPGPGLPNEHENLFKIIDASKDKSLFGVCLGHQAIAYALKGSIIRAKNIFHGKICEIITDEKGIFTNLPKNFNATRYHSLVVEEDTLPKDLTVSARTQQGTIMGIRHKNNIIEGIQFHPESIATEFGHKILDNFLGLIK